jgi:hypothetical protein
MMKKRIQFGLIVVGVIVLFDALASVLSRTLQIDYAKLFWVSFLLYLAAGYFGRKYFDFLTGLGGGFVAGLTDSTVGWLVSSVIGPYTSTPQQQYGIEIILFTVIIVSGLGAVFGLIGALVSKMIGRGPRLADA